MSHLAHVNDYRGYLTSQGVTCPYALNTACQEAYIRAILKRHARSQDSFTLAEDEENSIWVQLDKWNSVYPINASFIVESVKLRLTRIRGCLMKEGKTPGNAEFDVYLDVKRACPESGDTTVDKLDATDNDLFCELVHFLYNELVKGNE